MKQFWQLTMAGVIGAIISALAVSIAYQTTIVGDIHTNTANIASLRDSLQSEAENRKEADSVDIASTAAVIGLERSIVDQNTQLISLIRVQNQILNSK
jgi:hypothetical protein